MSEIGVNKIMLLGRSGGDADLKFTPAGTPVANFSLAVNESFKTRDGQKADRVEWFRCVCWNKLGEIAGQYVTRGKLVFVEGRLQTRKYDDRDGNGRTVTEVVVRQLRLLGGAGAANGKAESREATECEARPGDGRAQGVDSLDDSIPF
jgi:single-strand DNA-binding protein